MSVCVISIFILNMFYMYKNMKEVCFYFYYKVRLFAVVTEVLVRMTFVLFKGVSILQSYTSIFMYVFTVVTFQAGVCFTLMYKVWTVLRILFELD